MRERVYETAMGSIHYWMDVVNADEATLVFLPGLTADHRLFDKQIEFFRGRFNLFVWDAPGHAASLNFLLLSLSFHTQILMSLSAVSRKQDTSSAFSRVGS